MAFNDALRIPGISTNIAKRADANYVDNFDPTAYLFSEQLQTEASIYASVHYYGTDVVPGGHLLDNEARAEIESLQMQVQDLQSQLYELVSAVSIRDEALKSIAAHNTHHGRDDCFNSKRRLKEDRQFRAAAPHVSTATNALTLPALELPVQNEQRLSVNFNRNNFDDDQNKSNEENAKMELLHIRYRLKQFSGIVQDIANTEEFLSHFVCEKWKNDKYNRFDL